VSQVCNEAPSPPPPPITRGSRSCDFCCASKSSHFGFTNVQFARDCTKVNDVLTLLHLALFQRESARTTARATVPTGRRFTVQVCTDSVPQIRAYLPEQISMIAGYKHEVMFCVTERPSAQAIAGSCFLYCSDVLSDTRTSPECLRSSKDSVKGRNLLKILR
jgi:hypothetical protein